MRYFERTASAGTVFLAKSGQQNPFNSIQGSLSIVPFCLDFDSDGDLDCIFGEADGLIEYYENTGTTQIPSYSATIGSDNPFYGIDVGVRSHPFCVARNWNTDTNHEVYCYIGNGAGQIKLVENIGTASNPNGKAPHGPTTQQQTDRR